MTWTLSASLDDFRDQAGGFLAAHPAENTVPLTIVDRLGRDGLDAFGPESPRFGWWRPEPDAPIAGVFAQTPPHPVRLGRISVAAAAELAAVLAASGAALEGLSGESAAAEAFGAAWAQATGATATVERNQRLYRLAEPSEPDPAPAGRIRAATTADRELLIRWLDAFMVEVGFPALDHRRIVDRRTADGTFQLWEDDGRPVSLVGVGPVVAGTSKIGPVFTPPELRGRGYAGGAVAAGSAHARAGGAAEVLLFTDLANPTSNALYQRLGYRPVADCLVLDFTGRSR